MRYFFLPLGFIFLILSLSSQPANAFEGLLRLEEAQKPDVQRAIANAGENAETFWRILDDCPDEMLDGAVFLIGNMPVVDLAVMDYDTFMDNLTLAYEARETFPWASKVSEDDFFHYVLPYRVSQEPVENWRPFFYETVKELVAGAGTIEEATPAIWKWMNGVVKFKQTQWRDQGPFETLKSGYGRCEELMMFYIDAFRAVGIPARQAWTPYWAHCDNNHAWMEWMGDDGKWHNSEGGAKRAAIVMSMPFGIPEDDGVTELYRVVEGDNPYAIVNSTPNYRETSTLIITVADEEGKPLPGAKVVIYVFNYGALRPIARFDADENGQCAISIGPGDYFVSGGTEEKGAAQVARTLAGEIINCELVLGRVNIPESFWLEYPEP